jgi:uncharacterized protein YacL
MPRHQQARFERRWIASSRQLTPVGSDRAAPPTVSMSDAPRLALRLLGLAIGLGIGWQFGSVLAQVGGEDGPGETLFVIALAVGGIGYILGPRVSWSVVHNVQRAVREASVVDLIAIGVGLAFGGLISALVAVPLALLPSPYGSILPFVAAVGFIALTIGVTLTRKRDLILPLIKGRLTARPPVLPETRPAPPAATQPISDATNSANGALRAQPAAAPSEAPAGMLLDTSVIIDGRIADLARTGFLDSRLVVPRFVLHELQHIADSDDPLRRARGRRGLDALNRLRQEAPDRFGELEVVDADFGGAPPREVDAKLVSLAKRRGLKILTNDYNLARVAQIQGVTILNLHELTGALRPPVLPGEELSLRLVQEGREPGQAIGFLDDGTMVVVDGGRGMVGQQANVTVTRLHQTGAGRMVFAVPKHAHAST